MKLNCLEYCKSMRMKFQLYEIRVFCLHDASHKFHSIIFSSVVFICCPKNPFPPKISFSLSSNINQGKKSTIYTAFHCISDHVRSYTTGCPHHRKPGQKSSSMMATSIRCSGNPSHGGKSIGRVYNAFGRLTISCQPSPA